MLTGSQFIQFTQIRIRFNQTKNQFRIQVIISKILFIYFFLILSQRNNIRFQYNNNQHHHPST